MEATITIGLSLVILLGVSAQWLAHRIQMPSILLLLVAGIVAGPFTGVLLPDRLLGNLLFPIVSISVGIILFEGGLSLSFKEVRSSGRIITRLLTIGVLISWVASSFLAWFFLEFKPGLAILLGAILTVTGPTVIGPMLRFIRPQGDCGSILKWEGILVDPIGAMLAVLVYEVIVHDVSGGDRLLQALEVLLKTTLVGGLIGVAASAILVLAFYKGRVPDFLQNPVTLMFLITAFTGSNYLQEESGLLATTVMGIVLANQKWAPVKHIIEFKETLRTLLISSVFILLAANIKPEQLQTISLNTFFFLLALVLLARPLMVYLSTLGTRLDWRQRFFLGSMAPRGIVAAAVGSVFSLKLAGVYPEAELLVSTLFFVIVGTIAIYGLFTAPVGRLLGIAGANPQGVLIVGAHFWARRIAVLIQRFNLRVLLVDSNMYNVSSARSQNLEVIHGNILDEHVIDQLNLEKIGKLLAITSNDEANALACIQFQEVFGQDQVFQLAPFKNLAETTFHQADMPAALAGRCLGSESLTYGRIAELMRSGSTIELIAVGNHRNLGELLASRSQKLIPLAWLYADHRMAFFTPRQEQEMKQAHSLMALVAEQ
ncbi:MAG: sodium:proton antiporter [Leptospiraceae bacterium]|nr:sodium:proton antiporter [Leptospiraceae bacterium]